MGVKTLTKRIKTLLETNKKWICKHCNKEVVIDEEGFLELTFENRGNYSVIYQINISAYHYSCHLITSSEYMKWRLFEAPALKS